MLLYKSRERKIGEEEEEKKKKKKERRRRRRRKKKPSLRYGYMFWVVWNSKVLYGFP